MRILCISGPINNKDIAYIRTLPCLKKLDIRNATIAQGGGSFKLIVRKEASIFNIMVREKASIGVNERGDSYIGKYAFSNMNWETVLLPADLKILEEGVFLNCKNLKVLQLPDNASISGNLNSNGNELEHLIYLGESKYFRLPFPAKKVTLKNLSIWETLFGNIRNDYEKRVQVIHTMEDSHYILNRANSFKIPKYIDIIPRGAFSDCNLKGIGGKVIIPKSVRYIEDGTFYGSYIKEVVFENNSSLTSLGNSIFRECGYLRKVILPNSLKSIGDYVFHNCVALSSITFPTTLESIGAGAFGYCRRLTSIVLPQNLKKLGNGVFNKCDNLMSIVVKASVPPTISGQLGIYLYEVYIPVGSYEAYNAAKGWGELPLCYSGLKKKFIIDITTPGTLEKNLEVKVGKLYYGVTTSIQLIGDINTDDLEALHILVNLEEIDLSQTTLFYGEKLKKEMKSGIGMYQLIGGLVSLADKMADEEYKQGKMSTGKYVRNKLLNKTMSGGSVDKLEKRIDQLSEDLEKKFSKSMHFIPHDSFKGYSKLSLLKLPRGISSISVEQFDSGFIPKVYTSDNEQIIIQK